MVRPSDSKGTKSLRPEGSQVSDQERSVRAPVEDHRAAPSRLLLLTLPLTLML